MLQYVDWNEVFVVYGTPAAKCGFYVEEDI
jgi:hypothetical protein